MSIIIVFTLQVAESVLNIYNVGCGRILVEWNIRTKDSFSKDHY